LRWLKNLISLADLNTILIRVIDNSVVAYYFGPPCISTLFRIKMQQIAQHTLNSMKVKYSFKTLDAWTLNLSIHYCISAITQKSITEFSLSQWRRNEFESGGGGHVRQQAPEKNFSCPSTFFGSASTVSRLVSAFVMVSIQFGQFLEWCPSTHGAPVPSHLYKCGARVPRAPLSRRRGRLLSIIFWIPVLQTYMY